MARHHPVHLVAVFTDPGQASRAYQVLLEQGYPAERLSIIGRDEGGGDEAGELRFEFVP